MSWTRRIYRKFRSSDGRIKIATLFGVLAVAALAVLVGVLPAIAGNGDPSGLGVQPVERGYGGGAGACDAEFTGLPSAASHELHINNPIEGTYTGPDPDGTQVEIFNVVDDETFSFRFLNDSNPVTMAAFDVVVNGGSQNTHYDYDGSGGPGPVQGDSLLHAPTKGGSSNLFRLSHVNICYDEFVPNVTGIKYHDRDTDGDFDKTEEEGLAGWTITAFGGTGDPVTTETGADGSYTLGNLGAGTFTICEKTNTEGLPDDGTGFEWTWTQSEPKNSALLYAECTEFDGYEPDGYSIELANDEQLEENIDFGNHRQVAIVCDDEVVITLGGAGTNDNPHVTITIPAGTPSCSGGETWTTTFDVGRSADTDEWTQFVIFGDPVPLDSSYVLPNGVEPITQVIVWDKELADYDTSEDGFLTVTNTRVQFPGATALEDVVRCDTPNTNFPTIVTPQCLDSRMMAEGGSLGSKYIQITENYLLLGDPRSFR
jgi:hypothetical protein